jgi:hypothetical protein
VAKRPHNNLKCPRLGVAIEDCYVGPLCNNPRDELCPKDVVVEEQMLIVWSSIPHCAIWLVEKREIFTEV